jgi:aryl-alcohol dehydrogenase-like predicted oxidoreductase
VEALVRARDEGLTRFIGVTGHGLRIARMHLRSLERFDFDSVLFPYNFVLLRNDAYRADVEELLAVCAEGRVATQTIKAIARRRWRDDDPAPRYSWYAPVTEADVLGRAVRYVLARPGLFLLSSSDATRLPAILEAAQGGPAPTDDELAADAVAERMEPLFDGAELERI